MPESDVDVEAVETGQEPEGLPKTGEESGMYSTLGEGFILFGVVVLLLGSCVINLKY